MQSTRAWNSVDGGHYEPKSFITWSHTKTSHSLSPINLWCFLFLFFHPKKEKEKEIFLRLWERFLVCKCTEKKGVCEFSESENKKIQNFFFCLGFLLVIIKKKKSNKQKLSLTLGFSFLSLSLSTSHCKSAPHLFILVFYLVWIFTNTVKN